MEDHSGIPQDFVTAFEVASSRLRQTVAGTCAAPRPWPARVGAAILAVLDFAAAEREAARVLAVDSLAQGALGALLRQRLIDQFAELLAGEGNALPRLGPELVELTLCPYVGAAEAKRWAQCSIGPSGESSLRNLSSS